MKSISFATRNVPVFVEFMSIGVELAEAQKNGGLRIRQFDHTNSNGEERIVSPYMRESMERTIQETIERLKLPLRTRRDGLDVVVEVVGQ